MKRTPFLPAMTMVAAAIALAACDRAPSPPAGSADSAATAPAAADSDAAINVADFARHVETLASDEFAGRAPGSIGEDKTTEYLEAEFKRLGLQPGNGDSYFQTVPMVETTASDATVIKLDVDGEERELEFAADMVIGTRSGEPRVQIEDSELVFVGYGVNAPELGWNDYAGVDVKGKTVVMFVNDPGFHAQDAELFEGQRMTYYGRWTYKFEEAARQGAAAALIIHDNAGASYGWDVVRNSWSGPQFELPAADDPQPRLPAEGWVTADAARSLLDDLGHDLDQLYTAANKPGFEAIPLDATLSLDLESTITEKSSQNVVALLPGTERPEETIVYLAHWDHLGSHEGEGGDAPAADSIYNGAIDNATGVAGILEIAEAFAAQEPAPERSVMFLAVTLEESGLLGSKYFVAQPTIDLDKTVAAINLDAMPVIGRSKDMTVIGLGNSELEDILSEVATGQGRTLVAEATPQDGFYFRSDHFNFAKAGVPALYAKGGEDLVEGGVEGGRQAQMDYRDNRYHQAGDEFDPGWNMEGVVQDLEALYAVGRELAGGDTWPNWYEGNAFRAARDEARADNISE
ncbi:M28 family metallopeptidase [Novilysobacter spongiicola]|uniref:Zn-dependent amino-or carboxypeptidase, M28 family n=1 Tax=Lysobacter spongiicola DSM 21749 TaxID=1122188 RepID=A0A1T4RMI2_9GAMM|nr:M28 family metallopeptidase [Lysobacter spongiicola]SKA16881.1 Zn-dependent amino-or carboxypeptidase, M28 family [Lysobacter spongiicola DSM 21749]